MQFSMRSKDSRRYKTKIELTCDGVAELHMYEHDQSNPTFEKLKNEYFKNIKNVLAQKEHVPYFVTTVFNCDSNVPTKSQIEFMFEQYNRFYRHLTSQLMNNYTRKFELHPRTYDFVDFPNTRHKNSINFEEHKSPHIHSIYLVHKSTEVKFIQLMSEQHKLDVITEHKRSHTNDVRTFPSIMQAHVEPITRTDEDLYRVLSYSMKLLETPSAAYLAKQTDLSTQYPISRAELTERSSKHDKKYVDKYQKSENLLKKSSAKMLQFKQRVAV